MYLHRTGDRLAVSVRDNGCGFDLKELHQKEGLGILSMRERVRLLGGQFKIQSAPGRGTTVEVWIPLVLIDRDDVTSHS